MEKRCKNCFYSGMCSTPMPWKCSFYIPADEDIELGAFVEAGRKEYQDAWYAYVEEDD